MTDRRNVVLIVDDDRAVRDALQFALHLDGFVVHSYSGGGELLAEADLPAATRLIVDEKMPGMDGFELLTRLRAREISLPTILITSHLTGRLKARAVAAGVRSVLEKPLLDDVLSENVRAIVEQSSLVALKQPG